MSDGRRALRAFEGHLAEVLEVDDAAEVVDRLDRTVSEAFLDQRLDQQVDQLTNRMASLWRRDLLLISGAQFFALAAAVASLAALG